MSRTGSQLSAAFPIGLERDGRAVLLYLGSEPWTDGFRSFLQAHAGLLRVAPTWTLRLVFPRPLDRVYGAYQAVIREELESPLHPATINELRWYFEHRREAAERPVHPTTRGFLEKGAQLFGSPRFTQMYRMWLKHGDAVFEGPSSPAITEALNTGQGRVDCLVLSHTYRHLSPLVNHERSIAEDVEEGLRRGTAGGNTGPRALNPLPQPRVRRRSARPRCEARAAVVLDERAVGATTCTSAPRDAWGGVLCRPCQRLGQCRNGTET